MVCLTVRTAGALPSYSQNAALGQGHGCYHSANHHHHHLLLFLFFLLPSLSRLVFVLRYSFVLVLLLGILHFFNLLFGIFFLSLTAHHYLFRFFLVLHSLSVTVELE